MILKKFIFAAACCLCLISQAQTTLLEKARSCKVIDSSIIYAEHFIKESESKKDTLAMIEGAIYLADQYASKSRYKEAERLIQEALQLAIKKRDAKQQRWLYFELADKYNYEDENVKALEMYLKAYDLFEKAHDNDGLLKCIIDMAEFHRKIRVFNEAKVYIRKGFYLYHQKNLTDTNSLIRLNNRLAAIMIETGGVDSCIYYSNIAIDLSKRSNNKRKEAISLNEKGFAFKNSGRPDSAIICYEKAENIWRLIGADREALSALDNRIMLYSDYHYPKKIILAAYSKLIDIVNAKKIDYSLEDVYSSLRNIYLESGDTNKAFVYQQKYYEARIEILKKMYDVGITDIKEKYQNEKMKKDFSTVSSKLEESEIILDQKKRENVIIYTFITLLSALVLLVFYLLYRLFKSNGSLKQKNVEKDLLIQEIHHRVKNNLQFVSSLINMQINSSESSANSYSLNDASRRIKAMALVHEMLYSQNEMQGINIQNYLIELVDSINELVNSTQIPIQFQVNASDIIFDTQRAVAISMITSELVSNSIKYAFDNTDNPVITVLLMQEGTNIIYSVQDNGGGFKETNEQRKTLGMRLVSIFSRQLKGEYKFENTNGYKYTVTFSF